MKLLISLLIGSFLFSTSIYTISFYKAEGGAQTLSAFQGKKILLVNIATAGDSVSQLSGLRQLQQQFPDSLVVIAFPSNSFGNEPLDNQQIRQFCDSIYQTNFIIAAKEDVAGPNMQPVYRWLSDASENGALNLPTQGDYQKVLINEQGEIVGVFLASVSPGDQRIINAINASY